GRWSSVSRGERPVVIVDVAVPRDVDPSAGEGPGVHLLNLDDLQSIGRENIEGRRAFVPAAEKIVDEERDRLTAALDARASAPLITDLVDRVELVRYRELERHLAALPEDDELGRTALRALARGLTAKLLPAI